ncbi:hypothetical protein BGW38_003831 [Lunasporangiospora selenospora]|uniref:Fe2OG dioxygenase domain-containing protein n=1 Tax=Lunasporangiospora selenospora TaxID=979761 RepID=A0A9P6FQ49_9FUNG|nr:hypothetical protein BGW38_003831 [Lunasporangiospora selenospora]
MAPLYTASAPSRRTRARTSSFSSNALLSSLSTTSSATAIAAPAPKPAPTMVSIKTLSLLDFKNAATRPRFLQEMRDSLMEIGTFYIRDHGIAGEITDDAMKTVQDYFALPLEEKKKMLIGNSRHFRGYKLIGEEFTNSQVDHREQLQFGPEQQPLESFQPGQSLNYEGLQGPNQWPRSTLELLPSFQPVILDFMQRLEQLSQTLMEAVALSLGLDQDFFRTMFGPDPYYRLKCAKYPSVPHEKEAKIGCGAHKDTGFLTLLLQDMVGGLQGQDPVTGQWMDTRPIPESFIVTMGESVERLTGGLYHATVHRVLNNTSGYDRYSIPFFFDPALSQTIPHSIQDLNQSKVLDFEEALENAMTKMTTDEKKGETEVEGWSNGAHIFETVHRCHPEVYARWYDKEL